MTILNFAARALFLHFRGGIHLNWLNTSQDERSCWNNVWGQKMWRETRLFLARKSKLLCILILIPRPSIPATSYNRACCMINSYICSALSECTVCMSLPLADLIQDHSWYHDIKLLSHISLNCLIAMALPTIAPESPTGVRRQAASVAAVTWQGTVWLHQRCQIFGAAQPMSKCGDTVHWSNVLERNTRFVVLTSWSIKVQNVSKCTKQWLMIIIYMMHFSISSVRFSFSYHLLEWGKK